ncbi:MAG TPA: RecX family transcriptional regulator [Vicinamibacterales bacterium]|nr:RecX family transcriptional regulator [Vicinamibacterales bacterium]
MANPAYIEGLKMLARRELSEKQVRQRLARKEFDENAIDEAIARLVEERAIDDTRVAEAIARSETSVRKRGKLRVKRKIESAGIRPTIAKQAVDEVFGGLDADALLESALSKRLKRGQSIADEREFNRLYRYLVGQGFEPDRVLELLRTKK